MSYLKFDKTQLVNTEYSLNKEYIRTNGTGAFASSTIISCNTRKYHGMLICPIEEFNNENHVLLSSLDETIIQHGAAFNLGIHRYPGEYQPNGHKYAREYEIEQIPSITYRVGGVLLKKELLLVENEHQILFRYTLLEANSPTKIRLQPFLAFRNIHALTKANLTANTRSEDINNGIKVKLYEGFPYLHMQMSRKSEFVHVPDWHYNIEYREEKVRGYASHEDLFVPGYFEMDIKKGTPIIFSAGTKKVSPQVLSRLFSSEIKKRINRDSFESCLDHSAQQFISHTGKSTSIINGFPWFTTSERNTYIALPGLCLARNDEKTFLDILNTSYKSICNRLSYDPVLNKDKTTVDAPLWFFWALQKYVEFGADIKKLWKSYNKNIKEIFKAYKNGSHLDVIMHDNGLLWTMRQGVTWMKIRNFGKYLHPRMGYVIEVNALWYNAICFSLEMAKEADDKEFVNEWKDVPEMFKNSFIDTFWSEEKRMLADYVDADNANWEARPNQLFAVSLPYSCMTLEQKKSILDMIDKELLTRKGLRTLSPNDPHYEGVFCGNEYKRNQAFYNGSVFPWLIGHYAEAYLKLYKESGKSHIQKIFNGFEECMYSHGLASISQLHDGNPPHKPREATSYALSVAELVRVNQMLNNLSFD